MKLVKPPQTPHVNVLLYGAPKTGKTTGATSGPDGTLILNCDLPNATRFAHDRHEDGSLLEVGYESFNTLIEIVEAVGKNVVVDDQMITTVVVDPVGDLHRRMLEEASNRAVRPTMNQYGDVSTHLERWCRAMCELPVHFVIVAHDWLSKDESSGRIERLPWTGTSNTALGSKLMAMVDVVGYTGVIEQDEGREYVAQLVSEQGRRGGDRFDVLGDYRKLDLTEWFGQIAHPTKKEQVAA